MNFKKLQIIFIFLLIFLVVNGIYAQSKKLQKADKMYERLAFAESGKLYQEIVDEGNSSPEIYRKLGDSYYFNANYTEAVKSYSKLITSQQNIDPEYYFRYAQALNSVDRRAEASAVMNNYYSKTNKKDWSDSWSSDKFQNELKAQSGRYTIKPAEINSPFSDFGTAFLGKDKIMYASAKDTGIIVKRTHKWNDKPFLKLYTANVNSQNGLEKSVRIKGALNTKYHQSSPAITKDGKTIYFTRNNYNGKLIRDAESGISYLKIYSAKNIDGEWKEVKELAFPVNMENFSSAHPALSPDESELYFVSDRNNKFGNSDLYVIDLKKDGTAGTNIRKLGDEINTLGGETFPFVDSSGILYFSSDGHPGMGGWDVFAAKKDNNGIYQLVNLGNEINTKDDDFAYIINQDTKRGYFSSNRSGNDDIYSFIENKPPDFNFNKKTTEEPTKIVPVAKEDLTETLQLDKIYFDFNSYRIRESSKTELNKVIEVMKQRPTIIVKVNSHTDSRGRDDYNMELSDKRAKSTVNYIIKGGIPSDRISGEGFGEKMLVNKCENGIYCTEKEHQKNRRSEFLIEN